ncbi:TadE/TadG family type IV pilus assembly protein [Sphingobium aquiterrae]|uniref:TadE/TadG family type IV pilus assembly protein n=1 Tax=Sphingobium aquiterrae TaxID=2038656 RepID=UPI00301A22B3
MKPRARPSLIKSDLATAGAEMALVAPMLIILMFGSFELGNYFLSEHVVVKAVRDGARYASRLNITNYPCTAPATGLAPAGTVVDDTRNLTRTGQISGGSSRISSWTSATTITVTYDCVTSNSNADYSGIYNGMSNVPRIKVSAVVPYDSLFNDLGFTSTTLSMKAESQVSVMGI